MLYLPDNYAGKDDWPLIVFLHGSGERGDDFDKVAVHGPPKLVAEGKSFPFVILSPQIPENHWWMEKLEADTLSLLIDNIVKKYKIDEDRIYLTGLSMGGFTTWDMAIKYPDRFAAIAPICGGGDPSMASKISHLPTWVFHGAKDDIVKLEQSQRMIDALKQAKGKVKFTVYPDVDHGSWIPAYNDPELYKWFLQYKRSSNRKNSSP